MAAFWLSMFRDRSHYLYSAEPPVAARAVGVFPVG
jgi:hypothetical protein